MNTTTDSNVDPAELAKFSDIAHRWWDPDSEFRPLHEINPLRLNWIVDVAGGLADKDVLDVGCGGGILAEAMAREGARVTGIDLSERALGVARLHGLESGIAVDYRLVAAEAMAEESPGRFAVVTCMEMLEHVPDPASIVAACAKMAAPGATLFFATLNRNPKSYAFAILGAEYVLRLLPRGTHDWTKFIRPAELARYARHAGLDLVSQIGMTYNPLTRIYRLEPDTSVNYIAAYRKLSVIADAAARPLPVTAVLFDLDGTLADSAGDLALALNRIRHERGLPAVPVEDLRAYASSGARGLLYRGMGVTPDHADYDTLREAFLANYAECLAQTTTLFDGVEALLDGIEARGLAWGIVTNKHMRFTQSVVAALKLAPRAAVVVAGDTTPHPKPHPAPLLYAADALRVAPASCVYVGDDLRDVEAGQAAGMSTIVAGYGYMGTGGDPKRWPATGWIDRPLDLLDWLPGA